LELVFDINETHNFIRQIEFLLIFHAIMNIGFPDDKDVTEDQGIKKDRKQQG